MTKILHVFPDTIRLEGRWLAFIVADDERADHDSDYSYLPGRD